MNAPILATTTLLLALTMPAAASSAPPPSNQPPTVTVTINDLDTNGNTTNYPLQDLVSALLRTTTHNGTTPIQNELVLVKLGDDSSMVRALRAAIAAGDTVYVDLAYTLPDGTSQKLFAGSVMSIAEHLNGPDDWNGGLLLFDFQQETLKLTFTSWIAPDRASSR